MRTIVAFLFVATLVGQPPPLRESIERGETRLAATPDMLPMRGALLRLYFGVANGNGLPLDYVREGRRKHILWLIEHHPDAPDLGDPVGIIDREASPLADPEGYAEAARLWREQASKRDASTKTIANAVFFFKTSDRAAAVALLDPAWHAHLGDPALARVKGLLDVLTLLGATRLERFGQVAAGSAELRRTPEAKQALEEIEGSTNADLLGKAGQFLLEQSPFILREVPSMRERYLDLSEKWLNRAHDLDPKNNALASSLVQVFRLRAIGNSDPRERVKLLSEGLKLARTDSLQMDMLTNLANAEFEAGDDPGAERDARRVRDLAVKGRDNLVHQADTLLGRIALTRGDAKAAKEWLRASIQLKDFSSLQSIGPRMDLAQDLLDSGERDAVLQYLEQCRALWIYDGGSLDHFVRAVKAKGTPNLLDRWRPSGAALVRLKAPPFKVNEWTLDRLAGKVVALVFQNESCKSCPDELSLIEKLAKERDVMVLPVNVGDPAILEYRVETYPTLVVIDRRGQVAAYAAGNTHELTLRAQIERGINGPPEVRVLPAPKQLAALAWEPVEGAESYIVEWDSRNANGWIFDRDGSVRVIPTRETSLWLKLIDASSGRWRVYAVPTAGQPGKASNWKDFP